MHVEPITRTETAGPATAAPQAGSGSGKHRCPRCGSLALHRQRRTAWHRAVGYVTLLRPSRCGKCGYVRWRLPTRKDGYRPYLLNLWTVGTVLGLLWLFGLALSGSDSGEDLLPIVAGPPEAFRPHEVPREATAPDLAVLAPPERTVTDVNEEPSRDPEVIPAEAPAGAAPAGAAASAPAGAATPAGPVFRPIKAIQVVQEDQKVLITVQSDRTIDEYHTVPSGDPARVVIDLPGRWRLAENVQAGRRFGLGQPMRELTLGQHRDFLRLVLRMRESVGEPVITAAPAGLTIQLR